MSRVRRLRSRWVALLCAAAIVGCEHNTPTEPTAPTRPVSVIVEDSTGARVQGAITYALSTDSATIGSNRGYPRQTGSSGVASFALTDGHWNMFARITPNSSAIFMVGSSGVVGPRPASDTVLFRLVLRPASSARGRITLDGQGPDGHTLVEAGMWPFTLTADDGSFELNPLPPGSWPADARHNGFQPAHFTIVVPAAGGTTIDVGTIDLAPSDPIGRR